MYSMTGYKAGVEVSKSVEKFVSITTNKFLKSKYDSLFKEKLK